MRIAPWRWEDPINRSHTNPPPRYAVSGGNDDSIPVVSVLPTTWKNTSVGSLGLFRGKGSLGCPQPNTHGAREWHSPLGYTAAEPNVQLSFNHLMEHVPKVPPKALLDLERIRGRVDDEPCSRPERASGLNHPRTPVPESPSPRNLTLALPRSDHGLSFGRVRQCMGVASGHGPATARHPIVFPPRSPLHLDASPVLSRARYQSSHRAGRRA